MSARVARLGNEGINLFDRDRRRLVLALNDSQIVVEALLESNRDVELATIHGIVPRYVRGWVKRRVDCTDEEFELLPLFSLLAHRTSLYLRFAPTARRRGGTV